MNKGITLNDSCDGLPESENKDYSLNWDKVKIKGGFMRKAMIWLAILGFVIFGVWFLVHKINSEKAIAPDIQTARVYNLAALHFLKYKIPLEARRLEERAALYAPDDPIIWDNLVKICAKLGDNQGTSSALINQQKAVDRFNAKIQRENAMQKIKAEAKRDSEVKKK